MSINELSEYLKVSRSTLDKLVQHGRVPGQKVGRHWRFRRETIDRWLDAVVADRQRGWFSSALVRTHLVVTTRLRQVFPDTAD